MLTAEEIIKKLNLKLLPEEGGYYNQTWVTRDGTVIYYLITPDSWSGLHLLDIPEMWHFYAGSPLKQLQLFPDGTASRIVFSNRLDEGHEPQLLCPADVWQSTRLVEGGGWALVGTTMTPPYTDECIIFPDMDKLAEKYGRHIELIKEFV